MATNTIKTRVLLPRGTVDALSTRAFQAGELVMVNTDAGFKAIEITANGTGLVGAGAAQYVELSLSATQVLLSSGTSVQAALDAINVDKLNSLSTYAETKAQLSADGYALKTDISSAIGTLDVTDTAEETKFVTAVSETDGKISVTRAQPVISDISGLQTALDGKNKVEVAHTFEGEFTQTDLSVIKVTDADLTAYAAALDAGTLNQNAVYVLQLSALNALGQKVENVAPGTLSSDAATYGQLTAAISQITGDYATTTYVNEVSAALSTDYAAKVKAVDDKLSGYYLKSETSSATEINNALTGITDSLTAYAQTANLGINYDSTNKKILFAGGNDLSAEIDASDFIKDGMLSTATYDPATKNIILTFNTESGADPISIDVGDLVDTYTAGDTATIDMEVSNNEFTASIVEGSITPNLLSATAEWVFDCNM